MEKKTVKPAAKKTTVAKKPATKKPATKKPAAKAKPAANAKGIVVTPKGRVKLKSQAELNDGLKKAAKKIVKSVEGYTKADSAKKAKEVAAAFGEKKAAAKKPAAKAKPAVKKTVAKAKPAAKKPAKK